MKAEPIGVVADEPALAADHGVDGADAPRLSGDLIDEPEHRLFVRNRHVGAEHVVAAHAVEGRGELIVRGLLRLVAMG